MFLVCVSHFGAVFFDGRAVGWRAAFLRVGMVASPTFIVISGLLLGFLYRSASSDFARVRSLLIDRGLFLLTAGHLLMLWPLAHFYGGLHWFMLTDATGVSMIVGALCIDRVRPAARLAIGALIYSASWLAVFLWHPAGAYATFATETLVGSLTPSVYRYGAFPLLPWFSVYFAASALGDRVAQAYVRGGERRIARDIAAVAAACLGVATAAKLILGVCLHIRAIAQLSDGNAIGTLLFVPQKYPPSPAYLLVHGGIGLAILALFLWADARSWCARARAVAADFGRSSLFTFELQSYVYYWLLAAGAPWPTHAWPLYFAMSIAIVAGATLVWHRCKGNRILTVGLGRRPRRRVAPQRVGIVAHAASAVTLS